MREREERDAEEMRDKREMEGRWKGDGGERYHRIGRGTVMN